MNRLEFTAVRIACATIIALGLSVMVTACGGNDPSAPDSADPSGVCNFTFDGKEVPCAPSGAASGGNHG